MLLLSLLAPPLALLTPLPLKIAVDNVLGGHPLPHFSPQACRRHGLNRRAGCWALVLVLLVRRPC